MDVLAKFMDVLARADAAAAQGNALLAALVVLGACILSLEILQHLLAARALAALAMGVAWRFLLPPATQLRAILYAVATHGVSESVGQWRAGFPVVFSRNRDHCAMLWLLFWVRVFVWGATLGALAAFERRPASAGRAVAADAPPDSRTSVVAVAGYYEAVEVLLLLYFSAEPLPYQLSRRVVNWAAVLSLCCLERSTSWMPWGMDSLVVAGLSPVALVGVCVAVMWVSMLIPWSEIARQAAPEQHPRKASAFLDQGDHFVSKKRVAFVFSYAHEEGSSEDTALDTASDEEDDRR
jgi:hypothetical protein